MPKLTKRYVDALKATGKDVIVFDDELPGFGLRVKPNGARSFLIQYRQGGRTRRLTLGRYGRLTADEGRKLARQHLAAVGRGGDPSEDRHRANQAPTLAQFADRYMLEHAIGKKKPRSAEGDRRMLRDVILPRLGRRKVQDISRSEVVKLHQSLAATPYGANRVLALLSKMFNLAERWGVRQEGTNPCRYVDKYPEKRRERFLSGAELARLGEVLAAAEQRAAEPPPVIAAIRLLVLTGCRKSEILTLRWDDVDLERGALHLPDSKTGPKSVPLGAAAAEILAGIPRVAGNPYVFPGEKEGSHWVNVERSWRRLRKAAGLPEVRLHDLRHSYAAVGAAAGLGLPVIGKILGHTQPSTTQRYIHFADDPLRAAADRIAGEIAAAMRGGPAGEVIRFRPGGK
ncbi:MAG TPA: tyrosine-type recombinase/integrase [Thermoanaerobaculia bacterium]|nr:tyrosine-type recombinase/integrase [Thermoanaerobaculia bacterium]